MKTATIFRRVIAGGVAAVMALSLFGCGDDKEKPPYEQELDLVALYGEPVDYYGDWNTVSTAGDLQLEFNAQTKAIRISNTKTGSVWTSNPDDPDSDPIADTAAVEQMKSQVVVTYHDDSNNIGTMNSFTDAVELDQVTTYAVENGLAVHYVMGDASRDENDIPSQISDVRFKEAVLSKLSEEEATEMQDYYKLIDVEPEEGEEKEEPYWIFRMMYAEEIERILELFDKAGYTEADLLKDNAEFGIATTPPNRWQFEVTLVYRLESDGLVVDVPKESLRFPAEAPLYRLRILENLVSAPVDAEGYLFIPDGSGALMRFDPDKTDRNVLSLPIYGKNESIHATPTNLVAEQAHIPVYGIRKGNSALMAIVEDGAANATIEAYRANRNNTLNSVYTDFDICSVDYVHIAGSETKSSVPMYNTSALTGSCRLRFYMLEGEKADYVGMAATYQKYLLDKGALPEKSTETVPLVVDTIGGVYGYKNFLGLSYVGLKAATTFEENQTILQALKEQGVTDVQLKLSGWFNDGYAHSYPKSISVSGELGGKGDLKDLMAYCNEQGIELYPDVDMLQVYTTGNGFVTSFDASKYLDATEVMVYDRSYVDAKLKAPERMKPNYRYLLSPSRFAETFKGMLKGVGKLGLNNISLRSSGTMLYGDYNDDKMYERNQMQEILLEQVAGVAEKNGVLFNGANDYMWKYASVINGAPVDYSYYELESEAVPFYQLVTIGYIPQTGALLNTVDDLDQAVLRCVEYGVGVQVQMTYQPSSFLKSTEYDRLYRSCYEDLLPEVVKSYGKVKEVLDAVAGARMIDHEKLTDTVAKTVYENGVTVYVNYGESAYTADGQSVPGLGYAVVKK